MEYDIFTLWTIFTSVVTGASIILHAIAPLTKWTGDNKAVAFLDKLLRSISLNKTNEGKLQITVGSKK